MSKPTTPHTEEELREEFNKFREFKDFLSWDNVANFWLTRLKEDRRAVVENMLNSGELIEMVERIVINYANLSGRESENRGTFRRLVEEHIRGFLTSRLTALDNEE